MKTIRVAILGQGRSGRNIHGRYLKGCGERFTIAAVVDPIAERRNRAGEEYGCDVYSDHRPLLERDDLDLIINATPSHLHVPVSLEFLRAGFNVLCEKPLARWVEEVDSLITAAEEQGVVLAIFQQSRYSPAFRRMRRVIDSGVLGRIVQIGISYSGFSRRWDWQTLQEYYGGNLLNTGPHPLDQALQLFGVDRMPEVTCAMDRANTFGDAEDYVKVLLKGSDRPVIDLEISSCCAYPRVTYSVQGTQGGLEGSLRHLEWKYFQPAEAPRQELVREPLENEEGLPCYCSEELTWYEDSWDLPEEQSDLFEAMSGRFYTMLYGVLAEGGSLEITPAQVRQQIAVIEECHRQNPLERL